MAHRSVQSRKGDGDLFCLFGVILMALEPKKIPVPFSRGGAWSAVIMALALGCSSVNPHYDPTASTMVSSASVSQGPALAQAPGPSQTQSSSPTVNPSQTVSPWREDGTRVYRAAKPPVTSLNEALARAQPKTVPQAATTGDTTSQVAMKPVASPAMPASVACAASPAPVASPYSTYAPVPVLPIASRAPAAGSVTDALAAQAIQQTAASVPATTPEPKSNNQTPDRIRITSVVQDGGDSSVAK
jgi:hypothetical protein